MRAWPRSLIKGDKLGVSSLLSLRFPRPTERLLQRAHVTRVTPQIKFVALRNLKISGMITVTATVTGKFRSGRRQDESFPSYGP